MIGEDTPSDGSDTDLNELFLRYQADKRQRLLSDRSQEPLESTPDASMPSSSRGRIRKNVEQVLDFLSGESSKDKQSMQDKPGRHHPGTTPLGHSAPVSRKSSKLPLRSASVHRLSGSSCDRNQHGKHTQRNLSPPSFHPASKRRSSSSENDHAQDSDLPPRRPDEFREDGDYGSGNHRVLLEVHNMVHQLMKRVEGTEKELQNLKVRMSTPSSDSSSSSHGRKRTVPLTVRSETRKVYHSLLNDAEDFEGYDVGPQYTFKDDNNQSITQRLVKEVRAQNQTFQACDIRSAAYTYYKTLTQQESLERRGKMTERNRKRRRRERILRKLQERQAAFDKRDYAEGDKQKWKGVMVAELMSSEESDSENENSILVKPLPWRSTLVDEFFTTLDSQISSSRSSQSVRQFKQRVEGPPSSRPKPDNIPQWACFD